MQLNHWQKLGLPLALGICAGVLNWITVSRTLEPRTYVSLDAALEPGQPIKPSDLKKVVISHSRDAGLESVLIPWDHAPLIEGRLIQRSITRGSLLTQFDLATEIVVKVDAPANAKELSQIYVGDLVDLADPESPKKPLVRSCRLLSQSREGGTLRVRLAVDPAQRLNLPASAMLNKHRLLLSKTEAGTAD